MSIYVPGYITSREYMKWARERNANSGRMITVNAGTTVGLRFKNGVLLATETLSARNGMIISTSWQKTYRLQDHVYCVGSGMTCDVTTVIRLAKTMLAPLERCNSREKVPFVAVKHVMKTTLMAETFFANFILIGVDKTGVQLNSLHSDGTSENGMFNAGGNFKIPAMAILENRWCLDIDEENAVKLAIDAISVGYVNFVPASYNIDICIIRDDYSVQRSIEKIQKGEGRQIYVFYDMTEDSDNSDWADGLTVTSENVILLEPPLTPTPIPEPPESNHLPISSHGSRKTAATTQLHGAPPKKKPRLSGTQE